MKTKLTLLLAAFALSAPVFAGPADGAAFALRHARESAWEHRTVIVASNAGPVTYYVPSSSGKGGTVITRENDGGTNIALFKSKKSNNECSSCCKAGAKRQ